MQDTKIGEIKIDFKEQRLLIANYNTDSEKEKEKIEEMFSSENSGFIQKLAEKGLSIDGMTKIAIIESSVGVSTIVIFIAIYLGIIFLIICKIMIILEKNF